MQLMPEFKDAMQNAVNIANRLIKEDNERMWENAPALMMQRFNGELTRLMFQNLQIPLEQIPEAVELMTAIRVLKRLYPDMKVFEENPNF